MMIANESNTNAAKREKLFRRFQIEKFSRRKSVPCVSMTLDINVTDLQNSRKTYNSGKSESETATLTHALIKAVSVVLKEFPVLYSLFDGKNIISSKKIKINLPVSEGSHVEYVIIESPENKSLREIASEVKEEVDRIRAGRGGFYLWLKRLFMLPWCVRFFVLNMMFIGVRLAYKSYGNFPITNFGGFGVKNGTPITSAPIIAVLCFGAIQKQVCCTGEGKQESSDFLPVTLVFDHRPVDGAYAGGFLNKLKSLIEKNAALVFE
jgi:pyruvate/2-oxoglutarate dehydrogenase complex dihydrolipoamide acyltransferase (E2) component